MPPLIPLTASLVCGVHVLGVIRSQAGTEDDPSDLLHGVYEYVVVCLAPF